MSDPDREQFKKSLTDRLNEAGRIEKRYEEAEAAFKIAQAGGAVVDADLLVLEEDRRKLKAMKDEIQRQLSTLK